MITKEICRDYALKIKEETGKFPSNNDWKIINGYPTSAYKLRILFENYNNFRDYCGESQIKRTQDLSIEWIKSNCIIDENQCWNWNKGFSGYYGILHNDNKQYLAHRMSYELVNGKLSEELLVRHKCDNKKCCNPDHLESGSRKDNALDFINRKIDYNPQNNTNLSAYTRTLLSITEKVEFYLENIVILNSNCYISTLLKKLPSKYYSIKHNNKQFFLHRLILANKLGKNYGEIDVARHTCNNKSCINPDHLIEGSRRDNTIDFLAYSKNTKLTKEDVISVKQDLANWNLLIKGEKTKFDNKWSTVLQVNKETIASIRRNETWKHI
jgi:hypothetical protein